MPQGVLYLSREEGGQGLIHLASRTATFRLQFKKRFLTGPSDLVWRNVTSCIFRDVSKLGLDTALFLTDSKFLKLSGLPPFYQGVFKSWALFNHKPCQEANSLYWLLKEPLIHWARLDITNSTTPGLTGALCSSGTVCLQQLLDVVGPALDNAGALGTLLGLRSHRVAGRLLELWRQRLTIEEKRLLVDYNVGGTTPDPADPFPDVHLSPVVGELTGPLLTPCCPDKLSMNKADKKTIYANCVKSINRAGLSNRPPTVWTNRLGDHIGPGPQWKLFYKPPLKKRTADLQWRILHGAIASNSFISVLNPVVSSTCPFCNLRETVFHVFTECRRLAQFYTLSIGF